MKTLFTLLFILGFVFQNIAQDIDVYKKDRNDNYKMPKINDNMTYEEFELLSQNMRMKDMLYASVVPGYAHFKANDKKTGYWLLGIRSASYITMGVVYYSGKYNLTTLEYESLSEEDKKTLDRHENAFYTALTIATASYIYDIIHGDAVLHRKQERIRYKYALKAGKHPTGFSPSNSIYPNLAFSIQF
jgi:hypothetical protein